MSTKAASVAERTYAAAQMDPVASIILDALHKQDAATYNGSAGDIGTLALNAATDVRRALANGDEAPDV